MPEPQFSIDRPALERILQRAAELQASQRDIGEAMTPDDVLALGKEVGIPGQYLQQAMIEERSHITPSAPAGALDRIAGPTGVAAERVVLGSTEAVEQALVEYMEQHEVLCVQRQQPGRISWEPLSGFQAALRRSGAAFGSRRPFMLNSVRTVSATTLPLEAGYVHVRLEADMRGLRNQFVAGGASVASIGAVGSAVLALLSPFALIAAAPVVLGIGFGYFTMRQYHPKLSRIQLGLERALDHLQQGATRPRQVGGRSPRIMDLLAEEVRKALKP